MIKFFAALFFTANAWASWLAVDNSALTIPARFAAFALMALNIFTIAGLFVKRK